MQSQSATPVNWVTTALTALQWPVIVIAAFALGRYVSKLESRVFQAEKNIKDLIERHLPHVHTALNEIKESLAVLTGAITGRRQ